MASMREYIERARTPEKKARLKAQWYEVVQDHVVTCCCGQKRALELAYRCLYCGEWYCFNCAEIHFGMKVSDWLKQRETEGDDHDHRGGKKGPGR